MSFAAKAKSYYKPPCRIANIKGFMIAELFFGILQWISLVFIFTFHNYIKAITVVKLGDDTPKRLGFTTLNPLVHSDLIGTVILPLFLILLRTPIIFGWPRPVPIDYHRLRDINKDSLIISLVSIFSYFFIASVGYLLYKLLLILPLPSNFDVLILLFKSVFLISAFFAFLNLLPIPPLDVGIVLLLLLKKDIDEIQRYSFYGSFVILILFMSGLINYLFQPIIKFLVSLL